MVFDKRSVIVILVTMIAISGLIVVPLIVVPLIREGNTSEASEEGYPSPTNVETVVDSSDIKKTTSGRARISLSLGAQPLNAIFSGGKFIYIVEDRKVDEKEGHAKKVILRIIDLRSMTVETSVVIDEYSVSPSGTGPCISEDGSGKSGYPSYRLLGYDGRYVYYARECPNTPYLYVVDLLNSRVVNTGIKTYWLAAVRDGVAYEYKDGTISATDVVEGRVLWSHKLTPGYVFPEPQGPGRAFTGVLKGAWVDDNSLILLLQDSDQATGELVWVYSLVVASEEGVRESYLEAFRVKSDFASYDIRVGFDGERVYVLTGLIWSYRGAYQGVVTLDSLALDGSAKRLLVREVGGAPEDGYLPLYLFVDDGRVGIGYAVWRNVVEAMDVGTVTRVEPPILVFETLTPEGEVLWAREIAVDIEQGKLLGFRENSLYFTDGRYVYKMGPDRAAEKLADLGTQGLSADTVLGAIIAAPILFPFLPFITPDTTTVMVMVDTTLYIYNGPEAQLLSVALG
ncbi:hypothetical protein APE_0007.1 [Aeropyrum pernix K1]|uniref:Uncharacterized protein n=1 Tax=Aeropyrum pernix (strain ATCC 700893 / DSM 11879 / JCM 9820 / NBRC 100138 / K1) TaxID=272557 RepID=Q9YG94_AERPE|nr:hypothetical protein [Aeropyrum pernix]BAA78916.2 hypothetical protein APE_0007.1 [Aeropyrum pernix K1]